MTNEEKNNKSLLSQASWARLEMTNEDKFGDKKRNSNS